MPGDPQRRQAPVLRVSRDGVEVLRIPLRPGELVVGRGAGCDVALPDPERRLSRAHLVLRVDGGAIEVEDRSTAGTRVQGRVLHNESALLEPGAMVEVPGWVLRFDPSRCAEESTVMPRDATAIALDAEERFFCIIARSPSMRSLLQEVRRVGPYTISVLVHGETGAGKEAVARGLHSSSGRRDGPWVPINCGALHAGTAHATLFGHERGAFTGAAERRNGAFLDARGGTLFLDEVGDLPLDLQASLLRVLETREVLPLGATRPVLADFRLVAATHKNLLDEVAAGRFREDLYYRLAISTLRVPPLRERHEDIEPLARQFLHVHAPGSAATLLPGAAHCLRTHHWPGNVRELRNVVLQAMLAAAPGPIEPRHIIAALAARPAHSATPAPVAPVVSPALSFLVPEPPLDDQAVDEALIEHGGNRTRAARALGIARSTLYERIRRHRALVG